MWRVQAALCGADPSWGVAAEMRRLLNISPVELEDPKGAAIELTPAAA